MKIKALNEENTLLVSRPECHKPIKIQTVEISLRVISK